MNTTVLYLTDNQLDSNIERVCKKYLLQAIKDLPLVSVSQKPIDLGQNISVGELPRSSLSICKQMKVGLSLIKTPFVAIAEHDCIYTDEHFKFIPPDKEKFWYNDNVWFVQYGRDKFGDGHGMFSIIKNRKANSQLICSTEQLIKSTDDRIEMMEDPDWLRRYPLGRIGEPGAMNYHHAMRLSRGHSIAHIREKLQKFIANYIGINWLTKIPNIDVRHNDNFTGNRRGSHRKIKLVPWGTIDEVFNV